MNNRKIEKKNRNHKLPCYRKRLEMKKKNVFKHKSQKKNKKQIADQDTQYPFEQQNVQEQFRNYLDELLTIYKVFLRSTIRLLTR